MKNLFSKLLFMGIAAMNIIACQDVPDPYEMPGTNVKQSALSEDVLHYTKNFKTWSTIAITPDQPWIKGDNYIQATGYQKWDGAEEKSNREVEGWLISPAIKTTDIDSVKFKFNQTIKYTNNVTGWENFHKIYVSDNFDGTNVTAATWKEIAFTPEASQYSDWTTYSSGEIQLPSEMTNKPAIFIAFWFKAPATGSTTWELVNFQMEKGTASAEIEEEEGETIGNEDNPITVAEAIKLINSYEDGGSSAQKAFVKGKVVSVGYYDTNHKSLSFYISDDGSANGQLQCYSCKGINGADINAKSEINVGDEVIVKGKLKKYVKDGNINPELDQGCEIVKLTKGEAPETKSTADNPLTVEEAIAIGAGKEFVKGFIVGSIEGQKFAEGAHFSTENASVSNIILASSADETDVKKCMAIQLPSGSDIRTKLNLKDNAGNLKKQVILYGSIENYFGQLGLKEVTYAILDGTSIGTDPTGDPTPQPSGDAALNTNFKTTGIGQWTIEDKNKPTEISAIWKHDSKYGMVATAYVSSSKKNYDSESWLVSPAIDLSNYTTATLKVHHAINFFASVDKAKEEVTVMARIGSGQWEKVPLSNWPSSLSWTFVDATADMSAFAGESNVQIAFRYTSTAAKAGTWEVEKVSIE